LVPGAAGDRLTFVLGVHPGPFWNSWRAPYKCCSLIPIPELR
jgi:hypothetical protein